MGWEGAEGLIISEEAMDVDDEKLAPLGVLMVVIAKVMRVGGGRWC